MLTAKSESEAWDVLADSFRSSWHCSNVLASEIIWGCDGLGSVRERRLNCLHFVFAKISKSTVTLQIGHEFESDEIFE